MSMGRDIFGLRRHSNVLLYPSQEELAAFLSRPVVTGGRRTTRDIAEYRALIDKTRPGERRQAAAGQKVFADVLRNTQFASTALATEVACYRYLLESLRATDVRKPAAFVRAADEEIAKLDPKKKGSAERIERLRAMSAERRRQLEDVVRKREAICAELTGIAQYVQEDLPKVRKICATALVILSDARLASQIERKIVEDLKAHFRHTLKTHPDRRSITPAYLEELTRDVATLGDELVAFRRDAAAMTEALYQSLLEHVDKAGAGIEQTRAQIAGRPCDGDVTDQKLFGAIEQTLVALLAGWQPESTLPEPKTKTPQTEIFDEKKQDILDSLFTQVSGERRAVVNRRSGLDRRHFKLGLLKTVERRNKSDRRTRKDRRTDEDIF